jgi:hypothetical protein
MKYYLTGLVLLSLTSCNIGGYDAGTGEYSLTRGDFVVAHTNAAYHVDYVITDDNDSLPISTPFSNAALVKANDNYRGIFYYNKVIDANKDTVAQPVSFSVVGVARPIKAVMISSDSIHTDPVYLQSVWCSGNRKYINFGLNILTGKVDGNDGVHHFGMIEDIIRTLTNGQKRVELRLYHDQNHVPEYYTSRIYISLPISFYNSVLSTGDSIIIKINTYKDGWVTKRFVYVQK